MTKEKVEEIRRLTKARHGLKKIIWSHDEAIVKLNDQIDEINREIEIKLIDLKFSN